MSSVCVFKRVSILKLATQARCASRKARASGRPHARQREAINLSRSSVRFFTWFLSFKIDLAETEGTKPAFAGIAPFSVACRHVINEWTSQRLRHTKSLIIKVLYGKSLRDREKPSNIKPVNFYLVFCYPARVQKVNITGWDVVASWPVFLLRLYESLQRVGFLVWLVFN